MGEQEIFVLRWTSVMVFCKQLLEDIGEAKLLEKMDLEKSEKQLVNKMSQISLEYSTVAILQHFK